MTNKKLFELLKLVDGVNFNTWKIVNPIVDCIKEDGSIVIKKEWHKEHKKDVPELYPLDLSKIETWSTYEDCVDCNFTNINDKLYCKIKIYEGDNYSGYKKELRFKAELILPNKFLKKISGRIECYFESYLSDSYEAHLNSVKKNWIYNLRNDILNK